MGSTPSLSGPEHHRTAVALAFSLLVCSAAGVEAQTDAPATDAPPVDQTIETLQPRRPRTEAEADRITASAWYTRGRLLHQRGQKAAALRAYQRAWRYDPQAVTILTEIVPLAFELNRSDEAARYAVLVAEADSNDAILVRRLALFLADQRKWGRAVRLYERSLELEPALDEVTDLSSAVLHQEMGRLYFLSEESEESAVSFAKVRDALIASPPALDEQAQEVVLGDDAADTYSLWAESFLAAKRYDEALALYEKADGFRSDAGRLALQRARVEAARGNTGKALERLNEHFAASRDSSEPEPFELLAALLKKQHTDEGQARSALIERLEELRKQRPKDFALNHFLAEHWIAANRLDEAEKLLIEAIAGHPTSVGYRQLVSLYQQQRDASKLAELLSQVVEKTGSLLILEPELIAIGADVQFANQILHVTREQLRDRPNQLRKRQLFAAGLVGLKAERWDAASEMFEAQVQADATTKSDALLTWGLGLYLADQHKLAIPVFKRAIAEANGEDAVAIHLPLAGALELSGQSDEALATIDNAIRIEPESAEAASRKGWILYHARRYEDAAKAYRELIARLDSEHDSSLLRETIRDARQALSSVLLAQDKFAEATELLEQVLDEYPEDAGALNDLGYLWAERGLHLQRSLAMIQKAVAAEPKNRSYRDSLGWVLYQLGRYSDAVRELEQAAEGEDPDGVVLEHLGDAYAKAGQPENARSAWEKAVQAYREEKDADKVAAVRKKIAEHQSGKGTDQD